MKIEDISRLREKYECEYQIIGIRTQDVPFTIGDINHNSKIWVDGCETEEELDGISCTDLYTPYVDDLEQHISGYYYGEYKAIITGDSYEMGEDAGEIIIKGARVIEILS